ncbi:MAG TPA: hypothetical protein VEU97_11850 [Ktedonobacteraceae bacterium]|nr:hypothetical protein [Ktedonobacteraceae bacterium]
MTTPIDIGLPQIILFIIALVGLSLLISMLMGLRSRRVAGYNTAEDEEEARKFGRPRHHRHRRHWRLGRGISGVILLLIAVSLLWLTFLVQTYLGLTGDIKVARVHATSLANVQHEMSVDLTLYDKNGHPSSEQTYLVNGDEWMLQGDIIKFPTWLNVLGLHSSYKLTRLEGRFDVPDLERHATHTVVDLNGGDDNFFKTVQEQAWVSPIVQGAYGNAVFLGADGKTYDVFVSQTGLYATPEK